MIRCVRDFFPRNILLKLYHSLALPHVNLHLEIWGAAPAYQINILEVKMNNLLRLIFGIHRENGIPTMGAEEMYRTFRILRLGSLFKLRLLNYCIPFLMVNALNCLIFYCDHMLYITIMQLGGDYFAIQV